MKLTRDELLHATDKQLAVVGISRKYNAGWLKAAVHKEFAPELVQRFHKAARIKKAGIPKEHPDLFSPQSPEEYANEMYEANREEFR